MVSQNSSRGRTSVLKLRTLMSECPVYFGPDLTCVFHILSTKIWTIQCVCDSVIGRGVLLLMQFLRLPGRTSQSSLGRQLPVVIFGTCPSESVCCCCVWLSELQSFMSYVGGCSVASRTVMCDHPVSSDRSEGLGDAHNTSLSRWTLLYIHGGGKSQKDRYLEDVHLVGCCLLLFRQIV